VHDIVRVISIAQVTHGEEGYVQICKGMSLAWLAGSGYPGWQKEANPYCIVL